MPDVVKAFVYSHSVYPGRKAATPIKLTYGAIYLNKYILCYFLRFLCILQIAYNGVIYLVLVSLHHMLEGRLIALLQQ